MKKNLWYQLAIMMAVVLSIGLVACGGDDDDVNNSGSGNLPSKVSNSVLSSRLKDKNGNPVLLTKLGHDTFEYDENGRLTSLYSDKITGIVDGLNIKATEEGYEADFQFTLNDDGLIAKCSVVEKQTDSRGALKRISQGVDLFTYNNEKQLIQLYCESGYEEYYNEDGSVRERNELAGITMKYPTNTNTGEVNVCRQNTRKDCPYEMLFQGLYEIGLFGVGQSRFNEDVEMTLNENGTIAKEGGNGHYIYEYK